MKQPQQGKIRASGQYFHALIPIIEQAKVQVSALVLKPGLGGEQVMWLEKHQD